MVWICENHVYTLNTETGFHAFVLLFAFAVMFGEISAFTGWSHKFHTRTNVLNSQN